ncbi:reverse transcriptase family protein [Planctomycetota bacterium]
MPASTTTVAAWRKFFEDVGLRPDLIALYIPYITRLLDAGLPPIFEFRHLSSLLGRTPAYLASVVNCPDAHYRTFSIPKRRGGHRRIDAPYPALLACQQWIGRFVLSRLAAHEAVHSFRRDRSILSNARQHLGAKQLLKLDLQDFFPSIGIRRVIAVFSRLGYLPNVSFYLASICCLDGRLPQGAATSPGLSNIIPFRMDHRLFGLARSVGLHYTRYADDLTFSGEHVHPSLLRSISVIVQEEGFRLNEDKTRLSRRPGNRIVTGISVSGSAPRLPRSSKRRLRQNVHFVLKYGPSSHMSKRNIRDPLFLDSLYGKVLFWRWVEPDSTFAQEALEKLRHLMTDTSPDGT